MDGIKRIESMAEGQKDFVLLEVVKYLISRTDMDEKYLNNEKTLKGMVNYVQREILKDYCKKMNIKDVSSHAQEIKYGNKTVRCIGTGMSEEKVYELSINYFMKSNEELGIKNESKKKETLKINEKEDDDKFGSIFSEDNKVKETVNKKEKIEQLSFFSSILQ